MNMDTGPSETVFCDWCGCPLANHEIAKKDFDGTPSMICDCCEEELMEEDLGDLVNTDWIPDISEAEFFGPQPDCEVCFH